MTRCSTRKAGYTEEEARRRLECIKWWGWCWRHEQRIYKCHLCGKWHLTSQEFKPKRK